MVELMLTVSILAVGITLVLRSFLNTAGALDYAANRLDAAYLLEEKIAQLSEQALGQHGIQPASIQEEAQLNNRKAKYSLEITPISWEELKDDLNEVKASLSWQESGKGKDETLVTYMPNKK